MKDFQNFCLRVPTSPGVYKFLDGNKKVLYVGKAKNLRKRLQSYTRVTQVDPKIPVLVSLASSIDYTIVQTELEALVLEQQLIKRFRPRFNVRLRDDKQYCYVRVTFEDTFPRITMTRDISEKKGFFLGPYVRSTDLFATLKLLRKTYQFRQCTNKLFSRCSKSNRPCLDYHIKLCSAPCVGYCTASEYKEQLHKTIMILKGERQQLATQLRKNMLEASNEQQYEKATVLRNQLHALEGVMEKQRIISTTKQDFDVVGFARSGEEAVITLWNIREGAVRDVLHFQLDVPLLESDATLIEQFLLQQYQSMPLLPKTIVIPPISLSLQTLQTWFVQRTYTEKNAVLPDFVTPKQGERYKIFEMVMKDAEAYLVRIKQESGKPEKHLLEELQTVLQMQTFPSRIECYDISHLGGTNTVGSMIVFINGVAKKTMYRRFSLKTVSGGDDFAALQEVLTRRIAKIQEHSADISFGQTPDLIVIDGGKGQLKSVQEVISTVPSITLISLAKKFEEVFTPASTIPIHLSNSSPVSFLLQRIRDEAHRFANTYQQQKRSMSLQSSFLTIPGIGIKSLTVLRKTYGSLMHYNDIPEKDLITLLGAKKTRLLLQALQQEDSV
jgi:excinuclease ABC subunit C